MNVNLIGYISGTSILLPTAVAIYKLREKITEIKFIYFYIIIGLFFETINYFQSHLNRTTFLSDNIFNLSELCLLGYIIISWQKYMMLKKVNTILLSITIFIWLLSFAFFGLNNIQTNLKIIKSFCLIAISALYLYELIESDKTKSPKLIFTFSIFFYFLITSIIFSFSSFILCNEHQYFWLYYSVIHATTNILFNISIAFSLIKWKINY